MNAMIFAAGLGTRLRPMTDTCPKALIEIGGIPMLERVIRQLDKPEIDKIVVNTHHHARMIKSYIENRNSINNRKILISDESEKLLDTGGGLVNALSIIGEDESVLLFNADIFTDIDLNMMIQKYHETYCDALLLVDNRDTSRYLLADSDKMMKGWINTSTSQVRPEQLNIINLSKVAFGGIHIIGPRTIRVLKDYASKVNDVFSIMSFYIDNCETLRIATYKPDKSYRWHDIGRLSTLQALRQEFQ